MNARWEKFGDAIFELSIVVLVFFVVVVLVFFVVVVLFFVVLLVLVGAGQTDGLTDASYNSNID